MSQRHTPYGLRLAARAEANAELALSPVVDAQRAARLVDEQGGAAVGLGFQAIGELMAEVLPDSRVQLPPLCRHQPRRVGTFDVQAIPNDFAHSVAV